MDGDGSGLLGLVIGLFLAACAVAAALALFYLGLVAGVILLVLMGPGYLRLVWKQRRALHG